MLQREYVDAWAELERTTLEQGVRVRLWQAGVGPAVAVVATGSEVRLTGAVESMAARRRAGEVARAMPGVTSVDNRVGVRRGAARTTTPTPRL
jgi:hypothetical protein